MVFLNVCTCNSSTGQLLWVNTKYFLVELGILFFISSAPYNKMAVVYYMPSGRYKTLCTFKLNALYKLDFSEDFYDFPLFYEKDVYLMMHIFYSWQIQEFLFEILEVCCTKSSHLTIANISTINSQYISNKVFEAQSSNKLRGDIIKSFLNSNSKY